jgi:hypothetical protein
LRLVRRPSEEEDSLVKTGSSGGKLGGGGRVRERKTYWRLVRRPGEEKTPRQGQILVSKVRRRSKSSREEGLLEASSFFRRGRRLPRQDRIVRWKARRRRNSSRDEDLLEAGSSARRGRRRPRQGQIVGWEARWRRKS